MVVCSVTMNVRQRMVRPLSQTPRSVTFFLRQLGVRAQRQFHLDFKGPSVDTPLSPDTHPATALVHERAYSDHTGPRPQRLNSALIPPALMTIEWLMVILLLAAALVAVGRRWRSPVAWLGMAVFFG